MTAPARNPLDALGLHQSCVSEVTSPGVWDETSFSAAELSLNGVALATIPAGARILCNGITSGTGPAGIYITQAGGSGTISAVLSTTDPVRQFARVYVGNKTYIEQGSSTHSFLASSQGGGFDIIGRVANNPIIAHNGTGYESAQVQSYMAYPDPDDATQLIVYWIGMHLDVEANLPDVSALFRGTAPVTAPGNITRYVSNPIKTWTVGTFLDQILPPSETSDGNWWFYFSDNGGTSIKLFTSVDGITLTEDAASPVLTVSGQGRDDGDVISSMSVIKVSSSEYHGYYNRRKGGEILQGILHATSADGKHWTKDVSGGFLLRIQGGTPWQLFFEGQQILKIGSQYLLACANAQSFGEDDMRWTINVWRSDTPNFSSPTLVPEMQVTLQAQGLQVATPYFFKAGSQWYFAGQVTSNIGNYGHNRWDVNLYPLNGSIPDALPAAALTPEDYGTLAFWLNPISSKLTLDGSGYVTAAVDSSSHARTLAYGGTGAVFYHPTDAYCDNNPTIGTGSDGAYLDVAAAIVTAGGARTVIVVGYRTDSFGGAIARFGSPGTQFQVDMTWAGGTQYVCGDGVETSRGFTSAEPSIHVPFCLVLTTDASMNVTYCSINGVEKTLTGDTMAAEVGAYFELLRTWGGYVGGVWVYSAMTPTQRDDFLTQYVFVKFPSTAPVF
jgi:hypothetical protein